MYKDILDTESFNCLSNHKGTLTSAWLYFYIRKGNEGGVQTCCSTGVDINTCDDQGLTPLVRALHAGQFGIAEILLDDGADVNAKNSKDGHILGLYMEGQWAFREE